MRQLRAFEAKVQRHRKVGSPITRNRHIGPARPPSLSLGAAAVGGGSGNSAATTATATAPVAAPIGPAMPPTSAANSGMR